MQPNGKPFSLTSRGIYPDVYLGKQRATLHRGSGRRPVSLRHMQRQGVAQKGRGVAIASLQGQLCVQNSLRTRGDMNPRQQGVT